ncbi:MAG: cell envelope biogenesis protein OmpA [Kordia sp.]|nr:MAG: cell envelope biogenesis protein OmpA [Kordia sp.]
MKYIYIILSYIFISNAITAQHKGTMVIDNLFTLTKTDLNSENTEFGAVLTNDNLVYFTRTNNNLKAEDKNESDLDIYQAKLNSDNSITDIKTLDGINTKWHDGPSTVTTDGNTMYFASESFNVKKGFEKEKTPAKIYKKGKIYLFKASKTDNKWSNITPLPFNQINYSVRNPSISEDGKTLYFSSNMPGGFGGEDIWKVSISQNSYGKPENLGATINSNNDESFPFITSKNVLYFSSNKEAGFGGLDVYKIDFNKAHKIINVGAPINSEKDDFSFTLNDTKKTGFLSSNREGSDDIYIINEICRLYANITVSDKETGVLITDAQLNLTENTSAPKNISSLEEVTRIKLECEQQYGLLASKEGYENISHVIEKSVDGGELNINIKLQLIAKPIITETEVILNPIYFVFDTSYITNESAAELDKLVTVMKENPSMNIFVKSHTDNYGSASYNLILSNKRANSTVNYITSKGIAVDRINGKGFGKSEPKNSCKKCTLEQNSINRRSEFIIATK